MSAMLATDPEKVDDPAKVTNRFANGVQMRERVEVSGLWPPKATFRGQQNHFGGSTHLLPTTPLLQGKEGRTEGSI